MKRILTILPLMALLAACNTVKPEPDNPNTRSLTFPSTEIQAPWEGGELTIAVNANFDYKVATDADWLTEKSLSDASAPVFTAERNLLAGERTATVRFTDKTDRYYFKVVTDRKSVV